MTAGLLTIEGYFQSLINAAAFGNSNCRAKEQVKLVFKEENWSGDQLKTVQGLEDGSELRVCPLPHITLMIASLGGEAIIPDVDLNSTMLKFQ